jgi:hypothetical protein
MVFSPNKICAAVYYGKSDDIARKKILKPTGRRAGLNYHVFLPNQHGKT